MECQLGTQPGQDGFPLAQVRGHPLGLQVEQGHAAFQALHIGLRFTQHAEERHAQARGPFLEHLRGAGAGVEAHADAGDLAAARGHARQGHELGVAVGGRFAVEGRAADRHEDDVGEHDHARQVEAVQAAGGVEHDMGDAGRDAQDVLVHGPGGDRGQDFVALAQPGTGGLLAVHVAEHDGMALMGAPGREVSCECAFATPSLAIDHGDDRHPGSWR